MTARALVDAQPKDIRPCRSSAPTWFAAISAAGLTIPRSSELVEREFCPVAAGAGIGEFHLYGRQADTAWVRRQWTFPSATACICTLTPDDEALEILFRHNPKARIIWAHIGFSTSPEKVEAYLDRYPALWASCPIGTGLPARAVSCHRRGDGCSNATGSFPDRFRYLDQRALVQLPGHHGRIPCLVSQLLREVGKRLRFCNAERLFGQRTS